MFSRSAATSGSRGGEVDRLADRVAGRRRPGTPRRRARSRCSPRRRPAACSGCRAGRRRSSGAERNPSGAPVQVGLVVVPGADHAVRADEAAVAALDAEVGVPDGDQLGDVALLVRRRAARVGAVDRQRADRQVVAAAGHHLRGDGADELGRVRRHDRRRLAAWPSTRSGTSTRCRPSSARSTAAWLRSTTSAPRRP